MRHYAVLVALLLAVAATAQTDEWMRDDMSDNSLWLLKTSNLKTEATNPALLPGSIGGPSQWVMSQGEGPAYVVYFIPGRIEEVEIDTHRLAGASGDFSLAVSTDGKLYQPIDAGSVTLDSAFGWDYRLMSAENIPIDATHLLVRFPDGSSAHRLSEVWVRYQWDDALAARFLPAPVTQAPTPGVDDYSYQSDTELQAMLHQLQNVAPAQPVAVQANIPGHEQQSTPTATGITGASTEQPLVQVTPPAPTITTTQQGSKFQAAADFGFGDAGSTSSSETSTTSSEEEEKQKKETAEEEKLLIELHLDGTASKPADERTESTGSADKKGSGMEGKAEPEVVWVPPTSSTPVLVNAGNTSEKPHDSPTVIVKIVDNSAEPETRTPDDEADQKGAVDSSSPLLAQPAVDDHPDSEASAPIHVGEITNKTETIAADANSIAVTQESPAVPSLPVASPATPEAAKGAAAPEEDRPAVAFTRHGPRSKSHFVIRR